MPGSQSTLDELDVNRHPVGGQLSSNSRPEDQDLGKEIDMLPQALFFVSVAFGFIAWGIIAAQIWPVLHRRPRVEALRPLLMLHSFRFEGLAFLVPGVVSPELPAAFAVSAAYGDLIAAMLAVLSLLLLSSRSGIVIVWMLNLWGSVDLLNAFFQANRAGLEAGQLGAAYLIPTVFVPLLLITHGMMFALLLQHQRESAVEDNRRRA
jgi:hypothetical protein